MLHTMEKDCPVRSAKRITFIRLTSLALVGAVVLTATARSSAPAYPATGAAAKVTFKVIASVVGGAVAWLNDQEQSCAAAVAAGAGGSDCTWRAKAKNDLGSYWALIEHEESNACAYAFGVAHSEVGIAGTSISQDHGAHASAIRWPLHSASDYHRGEGWAEGRVNGLFEIDRAASAFANQGMFQLEVSFTPDDFQVEAGRAGTRIAWDCGIELDGVVVWFTKGSLDGLGVLDVEGDIPESAFLPTYDASTNTLSVLPDAYTVTLPILQLAPGETREVDVETWSTTMSEDQDGTGPSPCSQVYCTGPDQLGTPTIQNCGLDGTGNVITVTDAGPTLFALLLVAPTSGSISDPPGALGDLCVGPAMIGRYTADLQAPLGAGSYSVDLYGGNTGAGTGALPSPPGGVLQPGDTWYFQSWHRLPGGQTRFSEALEATFH